MSSAPGRHALGRLLRMQELFRELFPEEGRGMSRGVAELLSSGGKRLRPALACTAAGFGKVAAEDIVPLMAMLELMHTASLVHDDVVDRSDLRRGAPTLNALYGNFFAVQSGDLILGRTMELLGRYRGTGINEILAETSVEMCRGELEQLRSEFRPERQDKERYFRQITRKTASLMAASCQTGAMAAGLDPAWQKGLREYGLYLGIAFQLTDDALDFKADNGEGKPSGQDLERGILTLPMFRAMEQDPEHPLAKRLGKRNLSREEQEEALEWIRGCGGVEYTQRQAAEYTERGLLSLMVLPDCDAREVLIQTAKMLAVRSRLGSGTGKGGEQHEQRGAQAAYGGSGRPAL